MLIRDIWRRVSALETARGLQSSSIDGGALVIEDAGEIRISGGGRVVVEDAAGDRAVTLGLLTDSSFGLEVGDPVTGTSLPLSRLAFGASARSYPGLFSAAGNGTWRTDPGETPLTVTVSTGRLLVMVSAVLFDSNGTANSVMSWDLSGPTAIGPDAQRALVAPTMPAAAAYYSGSYAYLHTGLAPGV
jgi:hypothetical protein